MPKISLLGTPENLVKGSWEELAYDIFSGLTVGAYHSIRLTCNWILRLLHIRWAVIPQNIRDKNQGEKPSLKVAVVGYGRTGTYSLTMALEELGFPTLHTQHLYDSHEILEMWTEKVFLPSIEANEVKMGEPDFDMIVASGFSATADLPMALYYEQIAKQYPDCKFILTTRSSAETWFNSWDVLTKSIGLPCQYGTFVSSVRMLGYYLRWLFSIINKDKAYLTTPFPLPDQIKENAIVSYEEHNARVRRVISSERLLEFSFKDGWEPLCKFLEIDDCPNKPFPRSNSARAVQIQAVFSVIFPLTFTLLFLFSFFSYAFQRTTGTTVLNWISRFTKRTLKSFFGFFDSSQRGVNYSYKLARSEDKLH